MFQWTLFAASAEVGCDAVWEKDRNSHICYQFNLLSSLSWSEAHSSCQMQGGALLSIADEAEENFIRSKQVNIAIDTIKMTVVDNYIHVFNDIFWGGKTAFENIFLLFILSKLTPGILTGTAGHSIQHPVMSSLFSPPWSREGKARARDPGEFAAQAVESGRL